MHAVIMHIIEFILGHYYREVYLASATCVCFSPKRDRNSQGKRSQSKHWKESIRSISDMLSKLFVLSTATFTLTV